MQEDERTLQQSDGQDARDLLLSMTRCYLAELGTSRDLEVRSRIIVNGILDALDRPDLQLSSALRFEAELRH
jgi:hypothetical protein